MKKTLTKKDYQDIIDYYKMKKSKKNNKSNKNNNKNNKKSNKNNNTTKKLNTNNIKKKAKRLLANKFCRCIKMVSKNESTSIPICKKSVFHNKGLTIGKFTCKKRKPIRIYKY